MKKILQFVVCIIGISTYAQVGINYTPDGTEKAPLIIKKSNTIPALRIQTNQNIQQDQVLFSDDFGNVSWRTYGLINVPAVSGVFGSGITHMFNSTQTNITNALYTNAYIDLPPGKWAVNLVFNLDIKTIARSNSSSPYVESNLNVNQYIWARITLSDNNSSDQGYNANATQDRVINNLYLSSGMLQGPTSSSIVKGEIYIHNQQNTNKRYYLKISLEYNRANYTLGSNNRIRLKDFARGPSIEANAVDRFFAVYAGE